MSKILGLENETRKLDGLSPAGYSLGLHIRFSGPLIAVQTYPDAWQKHYTENAYALRDPLIAWGFATKGATRWSDVKIPDPFNIMQQAAEHGLIYGVALSCGVVTSRTIAGAARSDREFNDEEMDELLKIVEFLHVKTEPPQSLTTAQREALQLVAAGHRHAEAAARLGISESALKVRLTAARNRLLARTTAEAIQRAKDFRLL